MYVRVGRVDQNYDVDCGLYRVMFRHKENGMKIMTDKSIPSDPLSDSTRMSYK